MDMIVRVRKGCLGSCRTCPSVPLRMSPERDNVGLCSMIRLLYSAFTGDMPPKAAMWAAIGFNVQ